MALSFGAPGRAWLQIFLSLTSRDRPFSWKNAERRPQNLSLFYGHQKGKDLSKEHPREGKGSICFDDSKKIKFARSQSFGSSKSQLTYS